MSRTYRTIIEEDGEQYHGYAPALPGCHTFGPTLAQTKTRLREAIEVYLEDVIANGESIPTDGGYESFETVSIDEETKANA